MQQHTVTTQHQPAMMQHTVTTQQQPMMMQQQTVTRTVVQQARPPPRPTVVVMAQPKLPPPPQTLLQDKSYKGGLDVGIYMGTGCEDDRSVRNFIQNPKPKT